jgi:hypothetical protein
MRTTDFSVAPIQGRAAAMLVTERRFDSARDALRASGSLRAVAAHLAAAPGFHWQKRYRRSPHVLGIVSYFGERAELDNAVATLPPTLAAWVQLTGPASTGRILAAEPSGYTNGQWRAEDGQMALIERFTPTSVETARGTVPPVVATPTPRSRGKRQRRSPAERPWRPITDTHAMFLGATKYTGPVAIITQARIYLHHRDDLLVFARMPGHRHLMQWITKDTRNGSAGFIRLHTDPDEDSAR